MVKKSATEGKQFTLKWQLKFIAMIVFTAILFFLKIIIGNISNSMALIADSFHMLTDFIALIVGFIALKTANRSLKPGKTSNRKFTFGWTRAEVLGGLINTVFLMALCFSVFINSVKRFIVPEDIREPQPLLIVGGASALINFVGILFFYSPRRDKIFRCLSFNGKGKEHLVPEDTKCVTETKTEMNTKEISWQAEYESPHSLNIRGVYLHILEHFLISVIVIVNSIIVMFVNKPWVPYIDPACTLLVLFMILYSTIPLFQETLVLFMQSVPANIKVKDIEERLISKIPNILGIHEFHIWQLSGDVVVASAHLLFREEKDFQASSSSIKSFFRHQGIACMTVQPEFIPDDKRSIESFVEFDTCYSQCSQEKSNCQELQCCNSKKSI